MEGALHIWITEPMMMTEFFAAGYSLNETRTALDMMSPIFRPLPNQRSKFDCHQTHDGTNVLDGSEVTIGNLLPTKQLAILVNWKTSTRPIPAIDIYALLLPMDDPITSC